MGASDLAKQLRVEAARLEAAAGKLREAAVVLEGPANKNGHTDRSTSADPSGTRLDQIRAFLREHGPLQRRDVFAGLPIPRGTLSALLTAEHFDRDDEGRWSVKDDDDDES
jgi:hypothetical protein